MAIRLAVDAAVVGGGLVGLAVCRALAQRFPGARLALLDKEPTLGAPGAMRRPHPCARSGC